MLKHLLLVLIVATWALPPVLWIQVLRSHSAFYNHLRSYHAQAWRDAGSPGLSTNDPNASTSPGTVFSVSTPMSPFLLKRRYRDIADAKLHALGDRAFRYTAWGLPGSFLLIVLFMLLGSLRKAWFQA